MGRIDDAVAELKKAQELDPLSLLTAAAAARPYYNGRRYEDAIAQARRALEIDSTFSRAHYWLGMSFAETGRPREAIREFEATLRSAGPLPAYRAALGRAYALAGDTSRAREILRELEEAARTKPVSSVEVATVHAALDQKEHASNGWTGRWRRVTRTSSTSPWTNGSTDTARIRDSRTCCAGWGSPRR